MLQRVNISSGTVGLFLKSSEGARGRYRGKANSSSLCARFCVPVSKLINTEWVNNFVFSLCYKDSVVFGQVTSGNIIKYFSNSAFFKPYSALGKCLQIHLESGGGRRPAWGVGSAVKGSSRWRLATLRRETNSGKHLWFIHSLTQSLICFLINSKWARESTMYNGLLKGFKILSKQ